ELVRRLLQNEQIKLATHKLGEIPKYGRDFLRQQVYVEQALQPRFPDVSVVDLQEAWRDIVKRAKLVQHHVISREELSVREHMSIVLRKLQGRKFVEFEHLFDPARGMPVLVVTFIALLELSKEGLIDVTQAEAYAPIYVRLAYTPV
ncbi:MAG: ScpA family protein, partial [Polaromonas sp.]|nr:ScpA family protein [Polaromonas sp.]